MKQLYMLTYVYWLITSNRFDLWLPFGVWFCLIDLQRDTGSQHFMNYYFFEAWKKLCKKRRIEEDKYNGSTWTHSKPGKPAFYLMSQ